MKIAIDVSPLQSGHKVRGVGKYITLLKENIQEYDKNNTYLFFTSTNEITDDVDLIHYPYFDPFFRTLPLKRKRKTVVTVHDIIPIVHKKHFPAGVKGNITWQIQKYLLKKVDKIIVDSKASQEDLVEHIGIIKSKIDVVYLAVDKDFKNLNLTESKKEEIKKRLNLPNKFILYVGDVTWNKNLPRLVKACKLSNVNLVMVGKALAEEDFDTSNPWNHDKKIVLDYVKNDPLFLRLGFVSIEDLVSLYNTAELACMPSLDEGFGLPVLEAMQSGCPVLTSKEGSLPEVGGEAVEYTNAKSEEDMAKSIRTLFDNSDRRKELSRFGSIRSKEFSLEKMMLETVKSYTL